jgi:hypothetical protein
MNMKPPLGGQGCRTWFEPSRQFDQTPLVRYSCESLPFVSSEVETPRRAKPRLKVPGFARPAGARHVTEHLPDRAPPPPQRRSIAVQLVGE